MALNRYYENANIKQQALDTLVDGTSILIKFAELAVKLPGWSGGVEDLLEANVHDSTQASMYPEGGVLSGTRLDIVNALAAPINERVDGVSDHVHRYDDEAGTYTTADGVVHQLSDVDDDDDELSEDDEALIGDISSLDLNSVADLDDLDSIDEFDPDWWEDDEKVVEEGVVPADWVPQIIVSPPMEDAERTEAELHSCF